MSIVKMKRIALIGLDIEKEDLMHRLMDFGALELTEQNHKMQDELWANHTSFEDNQEEIAKLEAAINKAQSALDVIEKYGGLKSPFFKTRRRITREKFRQIEESEQAALGAVDFILNLQEKINEANEKLNRIEQDSFSLKPWEEYDLPLELRSTATTDIRLGVVPVTSDIDALIKELEDQVGAVLAKAVASDKDLHYLAVVSHKDFDEKVHEILKSFGFTPIPPTEKEGTIKANLRELENDYDEGMKQLNELKETVAEHVLLKEDIENYLDMKHIALESQKIKTRLLNTKRTFIVEGWVPEKSVPGLAKILYETDCYYQLRDPLPEENVPVLLKNSNFFTPIEAITEMYSLPDYRGFDPTSIYALFYICFFGMMFSDAGYGIMLAGGCYAILKKFDLEGNMYRMVKMFMYCGVATLFWGIMFGGFFGDLVAVFSRTFMSHEVAIPAVWFNPLDDPMTLLIFSLALGTIHLFIGMGINAYMEIRDGHPLDALFNEVSWYITIPGLALLLGGGAVGMPQLTPVGKYMSIVGVVMLIIGGARGRKGIGRITGAFSNVYSITSWMSDILSYARLLALGLATGVIAQVVNVMGSLFGGGVAGLILFVLIFLLGTAINFAINVLGSFIHSARLQYVEFFGKFYKDGGDPFKPFMKETKFIRIEDDEQ